MTLRAHASPYRDCLLGAVLTVVVGTAIAQPNPYVEVEDWLERPEGRAMGAASSVYVDADGDVWVADSRGRIFVADRSNGRVQIFDQQGNYLDEWRQFGRATGLYIADDDTIYVSDNQSDATRNPGWIRGIRIGSATDGSVAAFIPLPSFDPSVSAAIGAHGLAANRAGEIFGAEVGAATVRKYVRR